MKRLLLAAARRLPGRRLRCRVRGCSVVFLEPLGSEVALIVCDRCLTLGEAVLVGEAET